MIEPVLYKLQFIRKTDDSGIWSNIKEDYIDYDKALADLMRLRVYIPWDIVSQCRYRLIKYEVLDD